MKGAHIWIAAVGAVLRYSRAIYCCVFVRAYRFGASGALGPCEQPATHAVRAEAGGVIPLCLRHANHTAKNGGLRIFPKAS